MPRVPWIEETFMSAASLAMRSFRFERPKSGVLTRAPVETYDVRTQAANELPEPVPPD
jgi:hypothetical protein